MIQAFDQGKFVGRNAALSYFGNYINEKYDDTAVVHLEKLLEIENDLSKDFYEKLH